jgi:integrase
MARTTGRLTALKVAKATRPGMYCDGGGLYLQVTERGASWICRFMLNGRAREMGLGPLGSVSLSEARAKALNARRLRHEGIDPIEARKAERMRARLDAAKAMTFQQCADAYISAHRVGWRNGKHSAQWEATLKTYAGPVIGALPVQAVDTALVMKIIEPLWRIKPETASRLRGRIEAVLDWARVRGYRSGENPARWRGHLDKLLPAKSKVRKAQHHPALPYNQIGSFVEDLRLCSGVAARALEFVIMCAIRTGDIIGNERDEKPPMKWTHVDLKERVWTIPSTKTDIEHRVPLSHAAVKLLTAMKALARSDIVFPGAKAEQPLSNMAMIKVIRRMNADRTAHGLRRYVDPKQGNRDVTVHGFRSTFRDWAAERTNFPNEVVEMALAHAIDDKVEAAYRRGDLFEKRCWLMQQWATFCTTAPAEHSKVVSLRRG